MHNDSIAAAPGLLAQLADICNKGVVLGAPLAPLGHPARELVASDGSDE